MTDSTRSTAPSPTAQLARSAFALAFLALIASLITWIALIVSPSSPSPLFAQLRLLIIGGFGGLVAVIFGIAVWIFRTSEDDLVAPAGRVAAVLQRPWLAIGLIVVLFQANILAFMTLYNVAPAITNPAKFFMVCLSLLLVSTILIVNQGALARWLSRTGAFWQGVGISGVLLLIAGASLWSSNWLMQTTHVNDIVRGALDYRQLEFYTPDDDVPPSSQAYFIEQSQTRVRWSPYTYWLMQAFDGDYINIGADGIRETPQTTSPQAANQIFVFGGSTVWGEGARDAYTIPGHLADLLAATDTPAYVTNYGQTGYVSTQDMLLFQFQLARGNLPETAIFYQGFNDTLASYGAGYTGLTLQEQLRLNDAELGRQVRAGFPALRLPNDALTNYDFSQAAVEPTSADAIADRWLANVRLTRQLAEQHNVRALFVWQPSIIHKALAPQEQRLYDRWQSERAGLFELYTEVDAIVQQRVREENLDHIILMSDLFADTTEPLFIDLVHITEIGNRYVAEALLSYLR